MKIRTFRQDVWRQKGRFLEQRRRLPVSFALRKDIRNPDSRAFRHRKGEPSVDRNCTTFRKVLSIAGIYTAIHFEPNLK